MNDKLTVLAVSGSRWWSDSDILFETLDKFQEKFGCDILVTGNAKGADEFAVYWGRVRKIVVDSLRPEWMKYGKAAGPIRNTEIISRATHLIAFPIGSKKTSPGTWDTIGKAMRKKIPVQLVQQDPKHTEWMK